MSSTPAASSPCCPLCSSSPVYYPHPPSRATTVASTSSVGGYNLVLGQKSEQMQLVPGQDVRGHQKCPSPHCTKSICRKVRLTHRARPASWWDVLEWSHRHLPIPIYIPRMTQMKEFLNIHAKCQSPRR